MQGKFTVVPRLLASLQRRFAGIPRDDLGDLQQEVCVTALGRLHAYHGLAPLEAWLHRICVLTLLREARRRQRLGHTELPFEPAADTVPPLEAMADDEHRARIRAAIDAIGGMEATVLRQRHIEGLDFRDIAASTGIPFATVRTWYYRGLKKLKARLDDESAPTRSTP